MNSKGIEKQFQAANGTSSLTIHSEKRRFRSSYGWYTKVVSIVVNFTMLWQSAAFAGAFDMSFSAVKESRAHRRSGFFKPSEVREQSNKKRLLIHQRNALAKNLNRFNRKQKAVASHTGKLSKDVSRKIMEEQRFREQLKRDADKFAEESLQLGKTLAFHYIRSKPKQVKLANGKDTEVQKITYMNGGRVVGVFGEVVEDRDGSISIRNTYNMDYATSLIDEQAASYTSLTYDTNTGMVTISEWEEGEYWTEEDVDNDTVKDLEFTSGERVKGKLSSYKERVTTWYPSQDSFDAWTEDAKDFLFLSAVSDSVDHIHDEKDIWDISSFDVDNKFSSSYLENKGFAEGVTSETERSEMRYYTEANEMEDRSYIKDQMASYHEIRRSVPGRFSDTPALVSELDWYGATYDWAYKHDDDHRLVFQPRNDEYGVEDFVLLDDEKEYKRSISLITSYKEHSTDNIGHDSSREWKTFIKGGVSDDGNWKMDNGYDKFGRTLEYKELSTSVEGTNEAHRWNIEYWDWEALAGETHFIDDEYQARWNYGQVKGYEEDSHFFGSYSSENHELREFTVYDVYGRLKAYKSQSVNNGVHSSTVYEVKSYRDEGWVSNLVQSYVSKSVTEGVFTVTEHHNYSWDKYGQVLAYHEMITTDYGNGAKVVSEVLRLNIYKSESYLLEGY